MFDFWVGFFVGMGVSEALTRLAFWLRRQR